MRKGLYLLLLIIGLMAGLAFGHLSARVHQNSARRILYYKDPMHPAYRSDKPGVAPDCGMDLVPVYADDAMPIAADQSSEGVVIKPAIQQLYGIRLAKAEGDQGRGTIRVFARVAPDETQIYRINFGTDGYVKETQGDAVGQFVSKSQRLATVYSPDFLAVAGGYLAAHERDPMAPNVATQNFVANASQEAASVQARADRLRNLGMSDVQIDEITRTRRLPEDIYVVSPTDGFVLTRSISPGMRFQRGSDLYTVANLSHVWIVAEVYGQAAQAFRPGAEAVVTMPDTAQTFKARVSDVLPEVDPVTRAITVRLEADNPGYKLRPEMFVNVAVPITLPSGISVPADAIVDSGTSKRVFVQTAGGAFEPRTVETGWEFGDRVQIAKGLREGETVVSAGTFLVDSESKLQMIHASDQAMATVR